MTVDIARQRSAKVEGGDADDRTDRMSFTITMQNRSKNPIAGIKVELYLFVQSILQPKRFKLIQVFKGSADIEGFKSASLDTPKVETMWDNTFATFGDKYKGWIVRFLAPNGSLLLEKSSSSFFTNTDKLPSLKEGDYYDKALQPVERPRF